MAMHLCLPALIFVFWFENSSAVCIPKMYSANAKCEEALANDAKSYPACSTLDFSTQLLICELRSRADLDALRSGRRALPGLPPTNGNFDCLLTDCSTIVVCAPLPPYTFYICFEKATTSLVLDEQKTETYGDMWLSKYSYSTSGSGCPYVAKSTLMCADMFVLVSSAARYPDKNMCPQVGRKDPQTTALACKQYACKQSSANVVVTMPTGGWCQWRSCPNTYSILYVSDSEGHIWHTYAKRN